MNPVFASIQIERPLEILSACRTSDDALLLTTESTTDTHVIALLEELAHALVNQDWETATPIRHALLDALPPGHEDYLFFACAAAGLPGAAAQAAAGYAAIALDLALWSKQGGARAETDAERAVVRRIQERLRTASSLAIGWGAVAEGRSALGCTSGTKPAVHAKGIAVQVHAAIWCSIQLAAWTAGFTEGSAPEGDRDAGIGHAHEKALREEPEADARKPQGEGIVVVPHVGSASSAGGKEAAKAVAGILENRLPFVRITYERIDEVRRTLASEMPHGVGVIGALLSDLSPGKPIRFRPTVVVGEPGGGKSRLVRRPCEELGLPFGTFDAASADDHGITGSARRWASGYPSLPVSTVERHRVANPAILVDEIEKAGRSSAGSVHDPLLALIERSTARAWRDHNLDAEVDVSHVSWLFTVNALEGIPRPLRNRLRVLRMPRPGREHVPALAGFVLRDLLRERGVDPAWEPPFDGEETAALVAAWGGDGSVRGLPRYVEAILDARVHAVTRN